MIKLTKTDFQSLKSLEKYLLLFTLFFIGLLYFRFLPLNYDYDGTVFSQYLRYAVVKNDLTPILHPHHLFYFPCNYLLYKSLHWLTGYQVLEYFHLQIFSLLFGLFTLGVIYKILYKITDSRFFSITGVLLIAFSYGIWYYSVEAEVDMPGLFFIAAGIYLLFFKPFNTKNIVLSALLFSIAAGFHLTNGLIVLSVFFYFIYEKKSFVSILKFYLFYFFFLAIPYLFFYLSTKFDLVGEFKEQLSGSKDYFAGYKIVYWESFSFQSILDSLQVIATGILRPSSSLLSILSLLLLGLIAAVIAFPGKKETDKNIYFKMLFWMVPYLLFFTFWANTNLGFKLNVILPLLILAVYSLSRLNQNKAKKLIFVFVIFLVFVSNFYFSIKPANKPENNPGYQLAKAIENKTENESFIIIAGCGTKVSVFSKIYIPYFAYRKIFILDWMLGKGLSLEDIYVTIQKEKSKNKSLYLLSELTYMNKALKVLLENHHLDSGDFFRFIKRFEVKRKIPLTGEYFLLLL